MASSHWCRLSASQSTCCSAGHLGSCSSNYFLATMSVDRYLVVLATTQSRQTPRRTLHGAKITSLCVWIGVTIMVLALLLLCWCLQQ